MVPLRERLTGLARQRWLSVALLLLAATALAVMVAQRFLLVHTVAAVEPGPRTLQLVIKGAGELVAREQAEVASQVSLSVGEVLVDVGSTVRQGQPLALLDSAELRAQVRAAEAAELAARQAIEMARLAHSRSLAEHRRHEANAQRSVALAARGPDAISASELDASLSTATSAELDARSSRLQIDAAAQTHVQAEANLAVARARLAAATLRAPFNGLVVGRRCSAGDTSSPGSPCFTLVNPASLRVQARIDESALSMVREGDSAMLTLKSHLQSAVEGRVERINRSVDVDTREFSVDLQLAQLPESWALGERATVEVRAREHPSSLVIPLSHVVSRASRPGVWVAREGQAQWTPLRLGVSDGKRVEVLDGLVRGEPVLLPDAMRAGQRVRPELQPW